MKDEFPILWILHKINMAYSVVITIYNEKVILPDLIKKLKKLGQTIQVIIVDDGSDDGSEYMLNSNLPFTIVKNKINRGKGASIIKALNYIKNENTILIDGDLEIDVEDIPNYINLFENSTADVISGVRWGKNNKNNFHINRIGNFLINGLFNALFFSNVKDVLCCLKILNSDLLKSLNLNSKNFSIEVETMAKLFQRKK